MQELHCLFNSMERSPVLLTLNDGTWMQMVNVPKIWDFFSSQTTREGRRKDELCAMHLAHFLFMVEMMRCLTANRHDRHTQGRMQESAVQASHTSANTPDLKRINVWPVALLAASQHILPVIYSAEAQNSHQAWGWYQQLISFEN